MSKNISTHTETTSTVWGCSDNELIDITTSCEWAFGRDNPAGLVVEYSELVGLDKRPTWLEDVMEALYYEAPDLVYFTNVESANE